MAEELNVDWLMNAVGEVYAAWENYTNAKAGPVAKASYLITLNDRLFDLFSYHPKFNNRTGEIDGVFED